MGTVSLKPLVVEAEDLLSTTPFIYSFILTASNCLGLDRIASGRFSWRQVENFLNSVEAAHIVERASPHMAKCGLLLIASDCF